MKKVILVMAIGSIVLACSKHRNENKAEVVSKNKYSLIGKRGNITYPIFKAEVNYLSDSTLHWKVTTNDGQLHEGDEKITYIKLSEHQHFLNWIEKDGLTISQIIDTKAGEVKAFVSSNDEKSDRGKRSGFLLEGTIVLSNQ